MVDWGTFPLLGSTAAPSASIDEAAGIYTFGIRDQVLV
jgi:hypothetical protein